jgi:predicted dehydrogenase
LEAAVRQAKVAIIGCGYWGINYIRAMNELPNARVVAICDQRADRLREVEQRFPGMRFTTDMDEVLRLQDVTAVIVCTPATTHYHVTRQCLEAGKHILVEKPITTAEIDAAKLVAMAQARRLTLMVGHTFLYNAAVRRVRDYMQHEGVGRIYYLNACRTNLGPIRQDVNALWDLAPHDISIFNYWLDSIPVWVSAVGSSVLRKDREDVGFITLGYPGNITGHIHVSWVDPNKVREISIVGSEKRIVFNDLNGLEQVRVFEKGVKSVPAEAASYGEYQLLLRDGDIVSPRIEVSEPLKNQCMHFAECILDGSMPLTDGRFGQTVVRTMEAVDRSIKRNGAPVTLAEANVYSGSVDGIQDEALIATGKEAIYDGQERSMARAI